LTLRLAGRPTDVFAFPGSRPGDVRRRQIDDDAARAAYERKQREGGMAAGQGGRRILEVGIKEGGEEAGEQGAKKGTAGAGRRSGRRDNRTPGERQRDIDDGNAEMLRRIGDGLDNAGVPQAGTASQLAAPLLNREFRRYLKVRGEAAIDRARRLRGDAGRQLTALRVAQALRRSRPDVPQGLPRDVPAEVRRP